jgi:hypothetical protein
VPRNSAGRQQYERTNGTSSATAYVAGIAALFASVTGLKGTALRDVIVKHAKPLAQGKSSSNVLLARYVPQPLQQPAPAKPS